MARHVRGLRDSGEFVESTWSVRARGWSHRAHLESRL